MNIEEEKYFKNLGDCIRRLRELKGLDQKPFANQCGISRTQLYMIENGKTNPRLLTLLKIADGLDVELNELLKN